MNKFAATIFTASLFCFSAIINASEVLTPNTPEDWNRIQWITKTDDGLKVEKSGTLRTKNAVHFNPTKSYKLTMKVRRAPGSQPSAFYAIFMPSTDDGRNIAMHNACAIAKSEGELAAEAKAGDTVVKVKAVSPRHWSASGGRYICFNAKDDLSDLPNYQLSSKFAKTVNVNGVIEVTLRSALQAAYPAGTKVRIHAGGSFIYVVQVNKTPENWTEYSGVVKGINANWTNHNFPIGTASFHLGCMTNWGSKGTAVEFKDVKIEELD